MLGAVAIVRVVVEGFPPFAGSVLGLKVQFVIPAGTLLPQLIVTCELNPFIGVSVIVTLV